MHVMNGPSAATMLAIPRWSNSYDPKKNTVRLTLRTDASPHQFTRRALITEVSEEYETIFEAMAREDFEPWDVKLTGNLKLRGVIGGNWEFWGVYNPQTRKGTLRVVAPLTPEEERELDELDGLSELAGRNRGDF